MQTSISLSIVVHAVLGLLLSTSELASQQLIYNLRVTTNSAVPSRGVGDVDGDGRVDYMLLNETYSSGRGRAVIVSGRRGTVLREHVGTVGEVLGWRASGVGDVDKDGHADYAVGSYFSGNPRVTVFSGKTGSVRRQHLNVRAPSGVDDVDRDGYADYAFGDGRTTVTVVSGKTGKTIRTWVRKDLRFFGSFVAGMGDANLDGYPDVIVGTDRAGVLVYSGKDGKQLYHFTGVPWSGAGGYFVGDIDRDGRDDVAIWIGRRPGEVRVYSGRTGAMLHRIIAPTKNRTKQGMHFGETMAGIGDVDRDGYVDFAVADLVDHPVGELGLTWIYSGKTGKVIHTYDGAVLGLDARYVSSAGDANGDGIGDILIRDRVYSGAHLSCASDRHLHSLSKGGRQLFFLDAQVARAGQPFLLAGSLSGTKPGIVLGGHTVPLNPDALTAISLTNTNRYPYVNSNGRLDLFGKSAASITLPPGLSSALLGVTMHHAFITWSDTTGQVTHASNAAPLHFVK
jgi:hypothetical protein